MDMTRREIQVFAALVFAGACVVAGAMIVAFWAGLVVLGILTAFLALLVGTEAPQKVKR